MIMKNIVSDEFKQLNILDQVLHCAESSSFPFSVYDWDYRKDGGPVEHYKRMKKTRLETMLNVMINCVFSCCLLTPLVYLCKFTYHTGVDLLHEAFLKFTGPIRSEISVMINLNM